MEPLENIESKIKSLLSTNLKDNEFFETTLVVYIDGNLPNRKPSRWRIDVIYGSWSVAGSLMIELSKKRDRKYYREYIISDIDDYGAKINISYDEMIKEFINYLSNINELEVGPFTIQSATSVE